MASSSNEKKWLIKSSGRIMGPLTEEEVTNSLKEKEFVVLDECSEPYSRWKYLRDEPTFEKTIIELKNKESSLMESTFTGSSTITDGATQDISETIVEFNKEEAKNKVGGKKEPKTIVYSVEEEDTKSSSKLITTIIFVIALIVGVFVAKEFLNEPVKEVSIDAQSIRAKALELASLGQYKKAMPYFEKYYNEVKTDHDLSIEYAANMLQIKDAIGAQKIIEQILSNEGLQPKINTRASNLLGIVNLKLYNFDEGLRQFSMALETNNKHLPSLYNKAMVNYLKNDFNGAQLGLIKVMQEGAAEGILYIMLADTLAKLPTRNIPALNLLNQSIENYTNSAKSYHQELQVTKAYVYYLLNQPKRTIRILNNVLDSDPELTNSHIHDINYYQEKSPWNYIERWVKEMKQSVPNSPRLDTLLGYSLFKSRKRVEGKSIIESAMKVSPNDSLIQAVYSYIQMSSKKTENGLAALKSALQNNSYQLPFIMQARYCGEEGDIDCAQAMWQKVKLMEPQSLSAHYGLALIHYVKKDFVNSKKLTAAGLRLSPKYKPLLELKSSLNELRN